MARFYYTDAHLEFLREKYRVMNAADLTRAFNARFGLTKTRAAINTVLSNKNILCGRKGSDRLMPDRRIYKEEHEAFIRENYVHMSRKELTTAFNAAFDMAASEDSIKYCIVNRVIPSGRTGRFAKGFKPWNTGTKGLGLTGRNKTSFKKGNVPPNRRPLYSERVDNKDGYILIKVPERNPYTGAPTMFKHLHVWLYEHFNGPAPDGCVVVFKDGDKRNFDIDNLVAVKRAELLRLNRYGYKDAPDQVKPSIMALARLVTKTHELNRVLTEGEKDET